MNVNVPFPELEDDCPICYSYAKGDHITKSECEYCGNDRVILTSEGEAIIELVKRHLPRLLRELKEEGKMKHPVALPEPLPPKYEAENHANRR